MSTKTAQVESLLWLKQLPGFLLFCCSELFKQGLSYLAHNLAWHSDSVSSTFLSQDRRKLTPLLIVKEILQKPNGLWTLWCHPEPVDTAVVRMRCTCFHGNNLFTGVDSEAEWGHQGKVWCPLRGAHSSTDWEKEQLKGNKWAIVEKANVRESQRTSR